MAKKARSKGNKGNKPSGTYLSPGVYTEEAASGARPIEAVGTSVAALVGLAPLNVPRLAATGVILGVAAIVVLWGSQNARSS
jgi:phage tail sheath protein FI